MSVMILTLHNLKFFFSRLLRISVQHIAQKHGLARGETDSSSQILSADSGIAFVCHPVALG